MVKMIVAGEALVTNHDSPGALDSLLRVAFDPNRQGDAGRGWDECINHQKPVSTNIRWFLTMIEHILNISAAKAHQN